MASWANIDAVLTLGFGRKIVIEADDAGNRGFRKKKFFCDVSLNFPGQISENILSPVKDLDQAPASARIFKVDPQTVDEGVEFGELCSRPFRQFLATHDSFHLAVGC